MSGIASFGQDPSASRSFFPGGPDKFYIIKDIMHKRSFRKIGKFYAKDKNHAYFNYVRDIGSSQAVIVETYYLIEGADPETFKVMKTEDFSHDKNHVFHEGFLIEAADVKSFQPLNSSYSKDNKHVFFGNTIIDGADLSSFKVNGKYFYGYAYDKNYLYFHNDRVEIDIETFIIEPNPMDKNASYSFGTSKTDGKAKIGVRVHDKVRRQMSPITENKTDLIKDIMDENTFQEINKYYAKDSRHVYFNHIRIESEPRVPLSRFVETYFVIDGADPETFRLIDKDNIFSVDKNFAYYKGAPIDSVSSQGFTPLGKLYSKDNNGAYYENRKLDGADPHEFTVVYWYSDDAWYNDYAYDKNYLYSGNEKRKIDFETFVVDPQTKRCKDKNYHYDTSGRMIRTRERKDGD